MCEHDPSVSRQTYGYNYWMGLTDTMALNLNLLFRLIHHLLSVTNVLKVEPL